MTRKTARQRAIELVGQGMTYKDVATQMAAEGYTTPRGKPLSGKSWAVANMVGYRRKSRRRRRRTSETVSVGRSVVQGAQGRLKVVQAILGIEDMPDKDKTAYIGLLLS